MTIVIKNAEFNDLSSINHLMRLSKGYWGYDNAFLNQFINKLGVTEEYLQRNITKLCYIDEKFIGFYSFIKEKDDTLILDNFFLHSDYIKQGLGRQLWRLSCDTARDLGYSEFILFSDPNAENFYLKFGCFKIGEIPSPMVPNRVNPVLKYKLKTTESFESKDAHGMIEPHSNLLNKPVDGTLLYKIIASEYFLDMLAKKYLYFRRIDTYYDDIRDGDQPDKDKKLTQNIGFERSPQYTAQQYYSDSRSRTYACCFSTENTQHLWHHYQNQDLNAVCLVFDCYKLMKFINSRYTNGALIFQNKSYKNFFFINYGSVRYGKYDEMFLKEALPNPIEYAYFKDFSKYSEEKEFRITLSCLGIGKYRLDGNDFNFPESIQLEFDLREAASLGVLKEIIISQNHEKIFIQEVKIRANLDGVEWISD